MDEFAAARDLRRGEDGCDGICPLNDQRAGAGLALGITAQVGGAGAVQPRRTEGDVLALISGQVQIAAVHNVEVRTGDGCFFYAGKRGLVFILGKSDTAVPSNLHGGVLAVVNCAVAS